MRKLDKNKLNDLFMIAPVGVVLLSSWLVEKGYGVDLLKRYRKSGWLKSIGIGANVLLNSKVDYLGALYTLQNHLNLDIHIGGRNDFSFFGKSHSLELDAKQIYLFTSSNSSILPRWFKKYDWKVEMAVHNTSFLPPDIGLTHITIRGFRLKISGKARAIMECLYLAQNNEKLMECYELKNNMNNLNHVEVQELLENCNSIKVKKLFLYLAEKMNQGWFKYLDLSRIDLGRSTTICVKKGIFVEKFKMLVPKEWEGKNVKIDKKLNDIAIHTNAHLPTIGWLATIRSALGITTKQLGKRLNISSRATCYLEKGEMNKTITLKSLSKAAEALNCRLVYYLVPNKSLEDTIEKQIEKKDEESLLYIEHSMKLEDQEIEERKLYLDKLKQKIQLMKSNKIWE
jgi:predicted DNA-binding mobile mystery protein A